MGYAIEEVEGIGPAYASKLAQVGIKNTAGFLKHCADRSGRKKIAETTGISETLLLKWANLADLMRLKGIGPQFSELLEAAGVDTVKELRTRNTANLAEKLGEVQKAKKITRATPSDAQVARWIEEAKKVEPTISH
jgi:predicted flap endonuclease-1-like 5' DNA nuclease